MKKIILHLSCLLALLTTGTYAQNTFPTPSGNAGIGTTNPLNALHIFSLNNFQAGSLRFGHSGSNDLVMSFGWNGIDQDAFKISKYPHNGINDPIDLLSINSVGGNVGIGTSTPQSKLDVNGKIRAREIKVEASNWPDYVFNSEYYLTPLGKISEYIAKNGHLPELPSADQVSNDGIQLGEMNKLLLKKIEELTLHLIEKENQLDAQGKILLKVEERLKKLESK